MDSDSVCCDDDEESMREILHEDEELTVAVVLDDEGLSLELESRAEGPDLSTPHEVVVVANGRGCDLKVEGQQRVTADVDVELQPEPEPVKLMVRVFEFFEGWELFAE